MAMSLADLQMAQAFWPYVGAYEASPGIPHFAPISILSAYQYTALIIIPCAQVSLWSSRRLICPFPLQVYSLGNGVGQWSIWTNKQLQKAVYGHSQWCSSSYKGVHLHGDSN
jgi:hypothetical protein